MLIRYILTALCARGFFVVKKLKCQRFKEWLKIYSCGLDLMVLLPLDF